MSDSPNDFRMFTEAMLAPPVTRPASELARIAYVQLDPETGEPLEDQWVYLDGGTLEIGIYRFVPAPWWSPRRWYWAARRRLTR